MNDAARGLGLFVLVAAALVPYFAVLIVKGARRQAREEKRQTSWPQGRALVLHLEASHGGVDDNGVHYCVHARLRTADGREVTGWASGRYGRAARRWIGHEVPAWYDPDDPRQFRLSRPSSGVAVFLGVAAIVVLLAVPAVFGVIAFLATR